MIVFIRQQNNINIAIHLCHQRFNNLEFNTKYKVQQLITMIVFLLSRIIHSITGSVQTFITKCLFIALELTPVPQTWTCKHILNNYILRCFLNTNFIVNNDRTHSSQRFDWKSKVYHKCHPTIKYDTY